MRRNISIQLKAASLLIVFATNTVMGFACAIGINMGFNTKHHDDGVATDTPVHVHADGKMHHHHKDANTQHNLADKKFPEKGGCCNEKVVKFQNVEKNLVAKTIINAPAFVAIVSTFLGIELHNIYKSEPQKNLIRFFYPPPPDILIAIQKFQV